MAAQKAPKTHIESAAEVKRQAKSTVTSAEPVEKPSYMPEGQEDDRTQTDVPSDPSPVAPGGETPGHDASLRQGVSAWVGKTFPGNEHAVLGGLAGFVVALLVFVVGFWRALFVAALVLAGVALGQYLDGDPKIVNLIKSLFTEGHEG